MTLLFNSHGRLGLIDKDGLNERYLSFDLPNQVSWSYGPQFADRRRMILACYEEGNVQTHLWLYDRVKDQIIEEIATQNKPTPFMVCSGIIPGEERILANPIIDGKQRVWTMNLDGSDPREVTRAGDGFTYCALLSPNA